MDPPSYIPPRNDTDALSIYSTAPSYTSALPPTYEFAVEAPTLTTSSFPPRARQTTEQQYSSLLAENYHVASWSSLTGSEHQNRAYANVAARRARRDEAAKGREEAARVVMKHFQLQKTMDTAVRDDEDEMAKEGKSWDHLLSQMADWNERERSWNEYKKKYNEGGKKRKVFGKST